MKLHVFGRDFESSEKLRKRIIELGYEYSEENPDFVLCYGGDGIFLISERVFPGVPKVLVRDNSVCNMCVDLSTEEILERLSSGRFEIKKLRKIKAFHRGRFESRELIGVNDIVVRNSLPTEALRFRVFLNEPEDFIGDGLVVATPYGSSKGAYFFSIEQKSFDSGMGLAFNNISERKEAVFFNRGEKVEIEILRGPGVLVSDNNRDFINLERGDKIVVELIDEFAERVVFDG